jgi:pimeloyl-ACP methyl ester carboxylesterase
MHHAYNLYVKAYEGGPMEAVHEIRLSSGTVRYRQSGPDDGPVLLFVHGLLVDGRLWQDVVPRVEGWARCVVPDLPFGSHPIALDEGADASPRGAARLLAELLEALDVHDATLVANDTGGAITQLLLAHGPTDRVGRVVLTSCDAFDNFPPAMFKPLVLVARGPGVVRALATGMRRTPLKRAPFAYGWLTHRRLPAELLDAWLEPALRDRGVARDTARFLRSLRPADLVAAAERLPGFDRPVLVAWAADDRFFPREHGERLARLFPAGRFELVERSRTFLPLDRPDRLAELLEAFVRGQAATGATAAGSQSAG